jgi:cell wall-associated NlpC family hydrolase
MIPLLLSVWVAACATVPHEKQASTPQIMPQQEPRNQQNPSQKYQKTRPPTEPHITAEVFPQEAPVSALDADLPDTVQQILFDALSLKGVRYKYGGRTPETGFDCSGFVRYVFQQAAGIALPHNTKAISKLGASISAEHLIPGDLVFYNTRQTTFSHVGIYLGDDRFIHAPSSGGTVNIVSMTDSYWSARFNGARRITAP